MTLKVDGVYSTINEKAGILIKGWISMTTDWLGLKDKIVLVTGGSSGIGDAIVESLLNNGAKVVDLANSIINPNKNKKRPKAISYNGSS
ncbi:sorbitol-6-phosphate 2-dehydrogenase [Lactiplantibacillus plantarum]|nr:sorbitol-6-phosphate 2-dehydrogenase [Lactiplantibacillus plantarum]SPE13565.1 sorbitol-6-phosphate 2-dehydrogenase [Lactiplantibacillus plantarum]SPH08019.1 sorbitol-6-phosphate 2-dehydrogenase [Lactiplantibacillus plantarum]SPH10818.1 sorbitol-6-phosphate 2-dehydrogenase [Lactiplantibacillus plantarum]